MIVNKGIITTAKGAETCLYLVQSYNVALMRKIIRGVVIKTELTQMICESSETETIRITFTDLVLLLVLRC